MKGLIIASTGVSVALASSRHGSAASKAMFLQPDAAAPVHFVNKQGAKDPYWVENTIPASGSNDRDYLKDENPVESKKHLYTNPDWDKGDIQGAKKYADDYTTDSRPQYGMYAKKHTATTKEKETESRDVHIMEDRQPKCRIGHSADWYKDQCKEINESCDEKMKAAQAAYERDLSALEAEYRRQVRILEGKEEVHEDEKEDVEDQKHAVKKQKMKVKEAKEAVEENAHCPPDLKEAREKLAELEAIPNETPEDIEEECAARKRVLRLEACVEILREAEEVLHEEKEDYSGEKTQLGHEHGEADDAADALPPQEQRVADALAAWEAAKKKGPPSKASVYGFCDDQIDALKRQAEEDLKEAEEEYKRQKRILGGKEDDHAEEKDEVAEQEKKVAEEKEEVEAAKAKVAENDHCPAELDAASDRLSSLEAQPNHSPEDIEEECKLRKKILKLEKCVEVLREAEAVLSKQHIDYSEEKADLGEEESEEAHAASAVPPQEKRVACAKEALDAAKAALDAINSCSTSGGSAPTAAPEARSGASPVSSSSLVALAVAMFCALTTA